MTRQRTSYQGVYQRVSPTRMHKGKPDICYDISYKQGDRKRWEKVGWASEGYSPKLAADIRAERVRIIRHGEELPKQRKAQPTFGAVAEQYLSWAEGNKEDFGHDRARYHIYLKERFGEKRLNDVSTFELEKLKSDLRKQGLSEETVRHILKLVRQIFNKAVAWGIYAGENPAKGLKMPAPRNQRERFLTYQEAERLLEALPQDMRDMALLALHAGLRAGEIFALRTQAIDLKHGLITILDANNNQARKAHMTKAVQEMLKRRTANLGPNDLLFVNMHGGPFKIIPPAFRRVADALFNEGVSDPRQKVVFHSLRHSFASWLAIQGESLVVIRELMGHKSFSMVQRYARLSPDSRKSATLKLEQHFNGEGRKRVRRGA